MFLKLWLIYNTEPIPFEFYLGVSSNKQRCVNRASRGFIQCGLSTFTMGFYFISTNHCEIAVQNIFWNVILIAGWNMSLPFLTVNLYTILSGELPNNQLPINISTYFRFSLGQWSYFTYSVKDLCVKCYSNCFWPEIVCRQTQSIVIVTITHLRNKMAFEGRVAGCVLHYTRTEI